VLVVAVVRPEAATLSLQLDKLARVVHRKKTQHNLVYEREYRSVGANRQRE
jgi:hypothetical protein